MKPMHWLGQTRAVTFAAGALAVGLAAAGVAGVLSVHPAGSGTRAPSAVAAAPAAAVRPAGSAYFVCLGLQQWGLCIGPPTV